MSYESEIEADREAQDERENRAYPIVAAVEALTEALIAFEWDRANDTGWGVSAQRVNTARDDLRKAIAELLRK